MVTRRRYGPAMLRALAEVVFPAVCPGCGGRGEPLCAAVRADGPAARRCCRRRPGSTRLHVPFAYSGVVRELVARAKYRHRHAALAWLAAEMTRDARRAPAVDVVTWAPTTARPAPGAWVRPGRGARDAPSADALGPTGRCAAAPRRRRPPDRPVARRAHRCARVRGPGPASRGRRPTGAASSTTSSPRARRCGPRRRRCAAAGATAVVGAGRGPPALSRGAATLGPREAAWIPPTPGWRDCAPTSPPAPTRRRPMPSPSRSSAGSPARAIRARRPPCR